ncbi:MAG: DoxX family protein [Solirubrobacterales bacterium]
MEIVFLIGRVLFGLLFLASGLTVHMSRQGVEYARMYNAPAPELMVPLSGVAIIAGALSVMLGVWADLGALILAAFVISIAPIMHAYWKEEDPQMKATQQAMFMKNIALGGAALIVFYAYNQLQGAADLSITDPLFSRGG